MYTFYTQNDSRNKNVDRKTRQKVKFLEVKPIKLLVFMIISQ